jgi:hypothetical protein
MREELRIADRGSRIEDGGSRVEESVRLDGEARVCSIFDPLRSSIFTIILRLCQSESWFDC